MHFYCESHPLCGILLMYPKQRIQHRPLLHKQTLSQPQGHAATPCPRAHCLHFWKTPRTLLSPLTRWVSSQNARCLHRFSRYYSTCFLSDSLVPGFPNVSMRVQQELSVYVKQCGKIWEHKFLIPKTKERCSWELGKLFVDIMLF